MSYKHELICLFRVFFSLHPTILNYNYDIVLDTNLPGMLQTASAVWRILSRQTGHWDILPPLTWQWRGGRYGVVSHNDCSFESAGTQRHHGVGCRELKTIIYQFNPRKMWQGVFMNTLFWFHFLMVKISAHISWNISVYVKNALESSECFRRQIQKYFW